MKDFIVLRADTNRKTIIVHKYDTYHDAYTAMEKEYSNISRPCKYFNKNITRNGAYARNNGDTIFWNIKQSIELFTQESSTITDTGKPDKHIIIKMEHPDGDIQFVQGVYQSKYGILKVIAVDEIDCAMKFSNINDAKQIIYRLEYTGTKYSYMEYNDASKAHKYFNLFTEYMGINPDKIAEYKMYKPETVGENIVRTENAIAMTLRNGDKIIYAPKNDSSVTGIQ